MVKRILINPLFWVFVLAFVLRVYKLGEFPYGFHADEVRVGWQAMQGKLLPLYYNTFGDFRPTGIFYAAVPSILLFGKTEFAVRFPSALIGALSIIPLYLFVLELTKNKKLAFLSSFFLTISPWHIEVSRATGEAVIAAFLTLWGLYFFLRLIQSGNKKYLIHILIFTLLSYLFYHSVRLVTPIFFALTAVYFRAYKKPVLYAVFGTFLLTFLFSLDPSARGRLSQVSILSDVDVKYEIGNAKDLINNKYAIYTKRLVNEYAKYFGAEFLIGYGARPYRYVTPGMGIMTFIEAVLLVLGLVQIIRKKESALPLLLLLAAPIPAALTTEDSPNLMRAFYMVLFIAIICSYGLNSLGKYKRAAFSLLLLNFVFFLYMYFTHSYIHRPLLANADMDSPSFRSIGTKELVLKLERVKGDYEKIIVTGFPDNIRPWYEFFVGAVPENIQLTDLKCPSDDSFVENNPDSLLAIDSWQCSPESKIKGGLPIKVIEKITRPDKSEAFILVTRTEN